MYISPTNGWNERIMQNKIHKIAIILITVEVMHVLYQYVDHNMSTIPQ